MIDCLANLDNPLFEIRKRAVKSLVQKLKHEICDVKSLLDDDITLIERTVKLLQDNSMVIKKYAVELLYYLLQDLRGLLNFKEAGGFLLLQNLQSSVTPRLEENIKYLLEKFQQNVNTFNAEDMDNNNISVISTCSSSETDTESDLLDDNNASTSDNQHQFLCYENPILFQNFPWLTLTELDRKILENTSKALVDMKSSTFFGLMHLCNLVIFKDYPVEIFLQRPFLLQILLSHLSESSESQTVWRRQEVICDVLVSLNKLLILRLMNVNTGSQIKMGEIDNSSNVSSPLPERVQRCCARGTPPDLSVNVSVETVHENDDADEFFILKVDQISIIHWCCQLLTLTYYLLDTPHPRLMSAILRVIYPTMDILRSCINPSSLWFATSNQQLLMSRENADVVEEVTGSLLRHLETLSTLINKLYVEKEKCTLVRQAEDTTRKLHDVSLIFVYWTYLFAPDESLVMVFKDREMVSMCYLLCDPTFYSNYNEHHHHLLEIVRKMKSNWANQIEVLIGGVAKLKATKHFLQISSSNTFGFQNNVEDALPMLLMHKSRVFVEKMVRGLAKQVASSGSTQNEISFARRLILQLLSTPDEPSRALGYRAVYNLIKDNVGISQARNTSKSSSRKVLLVLHPRIINFLIFSGCSDDSEEIVEFSQKSILSLLRAHHLMTEDVIDVMVECFLACILNLQNLCISESVLGRAILEVPYLLLRLGKNTKEIEAMSTKFHLKCLFSKDMNVRQQALRNCLAIMVTASTLKPYISFDIHKIKVEDDCNLLILGRLVDLFSPLPLESMEWSSLQRSLKILEGQPRDSEILLAVWNQIAFLLHNPKLHENLESTWPIETTKLAFLSMMKVTGDRGLTVALVPSALEVLKLRASYSSEARLDLAGDETFLMVVLRALLFFKENDQVVRDVSVLYTLLLNEETMIQSRIVTTKNLEVPMQPFCNVSFPQITATAQYISIIHNLYRWKSEYVMDPFTRELLSMSYPKNLLIPAKPEMFYKFIWAIICAENLLELSEPFDYAQNFSSAFRLTPCESVILQTQLPVVYVNKLLTDIENSTTHKTVKVALTQLERILTVLENDSLRHKQILQSDKWVGALSRFFLCLPSTAMDKQILYHVMKVVQKVVQMVAPLASLDTLDCLCCSLIRILIAEFSLEESPLSSLMRLTGNVEFNPLSPSQEELQHIQLFHCLVETASSLLQLHDGWKCKCGKTQLDWDPFFLFLSKLMMTCIKKCKIVSNFNLVVLLPSLDVFLQLAKDCRVDESVSQLVPILIDLLMSFHAGRGKAHNAYLGNSVSIRCLLAIALILSRSEPASLSTLIDIVEDEVPSLPWLLAALEHVDQNLLAAGLQVVLALSASLSGARVLDEGLTDVPGGIWILIVRFFVRRDMAAFIRIICSRILCNLCCYACSLPSAEVPWQSLSLRDVQTGVGASGRLAFLETLNIFEVFGHIRRTVASIRPLNSELEIELPPLFNSCEMKDFVTSEESEWVSVDVIEEGEERLEVPAALIESHLRFLSTLLSVDFDFFMDQIVSSHIAHILVKHLALLTKEVITTRKWNGVIEQGFSLLLKMGHKFSQNTHLSSLAINLLQTDYTDNDTILGKSLELLSCMIVGGGWGAVRILELVRQDPAVTFRHILRFLHETSSYKNDAVTFVGSLCQSSCMKSPAEYIVRNSLKLLLDANEDDKKNESLGWELCRHLVQLLPTKHDSSLAITYSQKEEPDLRILLEALKLLLNVSESARICAYFCHLSLLKLFQYSLSNLREKILNVNIHISDNLFTKKVLKFDILFTMHVLQVSTNWLIEIKAQLSGDLAEPLLVGESLLPLIHPLWTPALRAYPLLEAILHFLITATSHEKICSVMTKTSILPGALLSSSRTTRSLLVSILTSVMQLLDRRLPPKGKCFNGCGSLPQELLTDAMDLIVNCCRVHESSYVIVKQRFIKSLIEFLGKSKELSSLIAQKCILALKTLTVHKEGRAALIKEPTWVHCMLQCSTVELLRLGVFSIFTNMVREEQVVKNMLTSDSFIKSMASILAEASNSIEIATADEVLHSCLVLLWTLTANNQRGKAIAQRFFIRPDLEKLRDHQKQSILCQNILNILDSE